MNHVSYRKRNFQDDVKTIFHEKADSKKKSNTIVLPELPIDPIVSWSRDDSSSKESEKYLPGKIDDLVLKCTTWPISTTSLCHYCCHSFTSTPIPIPETYDSLRKIYICRGLFCSWQCAKAYNIYYLPGSGCGNRNMNISLLAHRMWVKYLKENTTKTPNDKMRTYCIHNIEPAEDRTVLKAFGGNKSIEEYRRGFFGIVPPNEALTGKPFLSIRQRLSLPFVDGESKTMNTKLEHNSNSNEFGFNNESIRSMRSTQRIDTSKAHQESNKFCDMLNKAKTDGVIMKRTRVYKTIEMDGSVTGNTGVALISGSGIFAGDSITLLSGAREWRIRVPSARESADNVLYIEYKDGARWIEAQIFIVPQNISST